ncbi:MAG: diadenosine tetraphosphate hydrolase [Euryarchaeota archaeon]|nr:diadenosine tetraphosphate hydrolase [Euryarchaeota archaeon]|tara:strand:+ start:156 stop:635 length:480 start_codon:yes stop_codon:yes gene_type:complete
MNLLGKYNSRRYQTISLAGATGGDELETSCGVVLVNIDSVLLLQYPQGHWDLPKGHVEPTDVDHIATVRRELEEETGITELTFDQEFVERTAYTYRHKGRKREKEVFWFLAETNSLDVTLSHEHRGHLWLDWEQALAQLTHNETREVVRRAWDKVKSTL